MPALPSPKSNFWQYTDVPTGNVYQGFAEYLSYIPGRALIAYDHDSPNVRMDWRIDYARNTSTATVKLLTTGFTFTLRDRLILDDPGCSAVPFRPQARSKSAFVTEKSVIASRLAMTLFSIRGVETAS